jgi:hypothetical protein
LTDPVDPDSVYRELVVEAHPSADRSLLERELRSRGLQPIPMLVGFLVGGEIRDLRRLAPALAPVTTDVPIEPSLRPLVHAIRIMRPRTPHS